ncbi:glycosyltransferase family 4 protein [Mycobacteroides abscessus]|uniref:Glycosyl transferase n=4 Tax=Mycobacteroides abscessus TaxID=36809 RepID=B1MK42_MYCA9|nr:glycosyltransferase family 4 protein [Mycobacteroides abscessus]MBN7289923.1 glycosyltransferase family 4 protein [Mycobacteroides abscessus subsp. abscessus]MBN7298028.1 glycosyltransferase family 4 protein [Mycobacteroides abscessus subsp. abscessus]MBN7306994.1 glycosyltransferase family 4 protein [Mycobacteroides abscessus subsp. abscessus]MBN7312905.1 glycosyltransferase family 4 protein [Mycobacteroides abscessus subsp. abscessus]MBN7337033.1 glycosyltransferase family 4 protein [Myco
MFSELSDQQDLPREVLMLCWRDTAHPQGGGSETYLQRIGAELAASGVKVTLRCAAHPGAPRREVVDGVHISRAGGRFTVYPRALLSLLASRLGLGALRDVRPDVVIDTQNGIPFFASTVAPAPVVVLVHHCHREQWPVAGPLVGRLGWWLESRLSPRMHRRNQYLTVSQPSASDLVALGVEAGRIAVVRNGVDQTDPRIAGDAMNVRSETPRAVVLSRLVPHKQIEHALTTLAVLRDHVPDVHLDVVGDGWWMDPLVEYAARLGVSDAVTFHGYLDEESKHQVLQRAWVHLMPSRKEGWGLAVTEAAQHGVPTVGYRSSGGLTDSVTDGITGLLCRDQDEFVRHTATLLADNKLRYRMGEAARARCADLSWRRSAAGVSAVLKAAMDGAPISGIIGAEPEIAPQVEIPA